MPRDQFRPFTFKEKRSKPKPAPVTSTAANAKSSGQSGTAICDIDPDLDDDLEMRYLALEDDFVVIPRLIRQRENGEEQEKEEEQDSSDTEIDSLRGGKAQESRSGCDHQILTQYPDINTDSQAPYWETTQPEIENDIINVENEEQHLNQNVTTQLESMNSGNAQQPHDRNITTTLDGLDKPQISYRESVCQDSPSSSRHLHWLQGLRSLQSISNNAQELDQNRFERFQTHNITVGKVFFDAVLNDNVQSSVPLAEVPDLVRHRLGGSSNLSGLSLRFLEKDQWFVSGYAIESSIHDDQSAVRRAGLEHRYDEDSVDDSDEDESQVIVQYRRKKGTHCRKRWTEEEEHLIRSLKSNGDTWGSIYKQFSRKGYDRTLPAIRERWFQVLSKSPMSI